MLVPFPSVNIFYIQFFFNEVKTKMFYKQTYDYNLIRDADFAL